MRTSEKFGYFKNIFSSGSHGATGECYCGIHHYDTANDWDDDHHDNVLPGAIEAAESSPALYQFHDSAIEYLNLNGRLYVLGCRCGMDSFIFDFLNEEKQSVLSYYKQVKDKISVDDLE